MEKVAAVTGASGFIGKHLVQELKKRGFIVHEIGRDFTPVDCDIVYHLACPSTTKFINENTREVMDIIMDGTRKALQICPSALFVNASSIGAADIEKSKQGAYNVAKRCMEIYLEYALGPYRYINYRIPAVYGPGANPDSFIQRCVDGTALIPRQPSKMYAIAHVSDVAEALATCTQIPTEDITIGQIYELFNSGRRGIHRPAPNPGTV
jgi:nucleoside-diphosphate-sugar epimerase